MTDAYTDFLQTKLSRIETSGIDVACDEYDLMPHQRDLTRFALRRGRAAIFADTGLGKTRIQLAWADLLRKHSRISEQRVLQIAQAWSWVACGSLIIAERPDKSLWTVDGQHRVIAAMRRSDIAELPCLIFQSDGPDEEARAFYRANCIRGNVSPYDKLRALLACGDELARDAVEMIHSEGYEPSVNDAANTIRCISKFMSAMRSDRGVLQKIWPLVAELHRDAGNLSIRVRILAAFLYIGKFGSDDITSQHWRVRILKQGLSVITIAIERAAAICSNSSGARVFAQGALEVINKGVRSDHRLHLKETAEGQEE